MSKRRIHKNKKLLKNENLSILNKSRKQFYLLILSSITLLLFCVFVNDNISILNKLNVEISELTKNNENVYSSLQVKRITINEYDNYIALKQTQLHEFEQKQDLVKKQIDVLERQITNISDFIKVKNLDMLYKNLPSIIYDDYEYNQFYKKNPYIDILNRETNLLKELLNRENINELIELPRKIKTVSHNFKINADKQKNMNENFSLRRLDLAFNRYYLLIKEIELLDNKIEIKKIELLESPPDVELPDRFGIIKNIKVEIEDLEEEYTDNLHNLNDKKEEMELRTNKLKENVTAFNLPMVFYRIPFWTSIFLLILTIWFYIHFHKIYYWFVTNYKSYPWFFLYNDIISKIASYLTLSIPIIVSIYSCYVTNLQYTYYENYKEILSINFYNPLILKIFIAIIIIFELYIHLRIILIRLKLIKN